MAQELTQAQIDHVHAHLTRIGGRADCLVCAAHDFWHTHDMSSLYRICMHCGYIHEFNLAAFGWQAEGGWSVSIPLTLHLLRSTATE